MPGSNPEISVIVATRNRSKLLERFFISLTRLKNTPSWEIIISDNGSTDDTPVLLNKYSQLLPLFSYSVPEKGKSRALNKALDNARGKLLVFTDDDVQVSPHWLSAFYNAYKKNNDIRVFGGNIEIDYKSLPKWLLKAGRLQGLLTSSHSRGNVNSIYGINDYPFGPNMAVPASLVNSVNARWPQNVGPGTELPVGDERLFLYSLSKPTDADRLFVSGAKVYHQIENEQITISGAIKRFYLLGRSDAFMKRELYKNNLQCPLEIKSLIRQLITSINSIEFICVIARLFGRYT